MRAQSYSVAMVLVVCAGLACAQNSATRAQEARDKTQPSELNVDEIVDRVKKAYAACKTYRDQGELEITRPRMSKPDELHTTKQTFSIAFVRNDRLRIEVKDPYFKQDSHVVQIGAKTLSVCAHREARTISKSRFP